MNNLIKIAFLLSIYLSLSLNGFSQSVRFPYDARPYELREYPFLDSTILRVQYNMLSVQDVEKPQDKKENTMLLQIGHNMSKFYDYHRFYADSIGNSLALKKKPKSEANSEVISIMFGTQPINVFKNYPTGKITTLDRVPHNTYQYEEDMLEPQWILKSDTLTVCGYVCNKAEARYFGRNYTAWYAPEIPISDGPWKLFGLPGLILKAVDDQEHYSFECIGLDRPHWNDSIYYTTSKPFKVKKEFFNKLNKEFHANPAGNLESSGMTQTPIPEKNRKARPYNPIDLLDE